MEIVIYIISILNALYELLDTYLKIMMIKKAKKRNE
jgi:hypothetical protein